MPHPKVTIIILNWNGKEDTSECFESLKRITYPNYEILLVDNGSTDGSVECLRENFPEIEIIENKENLGYAEGNNVGIRKAKENGTDYILILNDDTVVDPEFLTELVKVAESDPKIGFAGPKVYYYDFNGRKDVIHSAGANINLWRGIPPPIIGVNEIDKGQYNQLNNVDYLEGACLLIKRNVIDKIGLLDAKYFMYWEETDWCTRSRNAGYSVVYVPNARIWHKISSSSNPRKIYYMVRNMFWFMKKHSSHRNYTYFILYFFGYYFWLNSFVRFRRDSKAFKLYCKGVIDGVIR